MFAIKKLIASFLMPFPLFLIFILIGILFWYREDQRRAKHMFLFSLLWISLLSYPPFGALLLKPLENMYPKFKSPTSPVHYIHVLGNAHVSNPNLPLSSQIGLVSLARVNEGITIYRSHPNMKLIFSGYRGTDRVSNAQINARMAITLGVNPNDIVLLELPKDTQEEAIAAKNIVGTDALILVTSASHMARASAIFRKVGINAIEAPTDFKIKKVDTLCQFPSAEGLERSEVAFHEYFGLLWERLKLIIL